MIITFDNQLECKFKIIDYERTGFNDDELDSDKKYLKQSPSLFKLSDIVHYPITNDKLSDRINDTHRVRLCHFIKLNSVTKMFTITVLSRVKCGYKDYKKCLYKCQRKKLPKTKMSLFKGGDNNRKIPLQLILKKK